VVSAPRAPTLRVLLESITTRLHGGQSLLAEHVLQLQQADEAVMADPLLQGMMESLMTQLRRAISLRQKGSLAQHQPDNEELRKIRIDPDQVIIKGMLGEFDFPLAAISLSLYCITM